MTPIFGGYRNWLLAVLLTAILTSRVGEASASPTRAREGAPIRSGCEIDYPPYCLVTPEGQADGFSVELLRAALQAMGRPVTFKTGVWPDIKQDLAEGRLDALPLVGRTPEREATYDFTFPYLTMHGAIIVREGNADIHGPIDLKGKRVAVLRGDNAEEYLRRANLGARIVPLSSFETALRELSSGKHDAVVIQKLLAFQLMRQAGIRNLTTAGPPLKGFTQSFCFAVREGDKSILATLNEGLAIVTADGTFRNLYAKWFSDIEAVGRTKSRIVVGGDGNYPPYEFLDRNGQPAGFNVELTRAVARQAGLAVDIQLGPWGRIRKGLANGDVDMVQGMFYSPERDRAFAFSPAHSVVQHVIAVRKGTTEPLDLKGLAGKSILVMAGDVMEDVAKSAGYAGQLVAVPSQEEALRLLASGRHDCALVAKVPALYWIKKHRWGNLKVCGSPLLSADYCYAVPRGNEKLLAQFTEGLAAVKATGEYRGIVSRWLGPYETPGTDWRTIAKYVLASVLPLLALLIASIHWSRTLSRQVAARTQDLTAEVAERERAERSVRDREAELRLIMDATPALISYVGADLRYRRVNRSYERWFGRTPEQVEGRHVQDVLGEAAWERVRPYVDRVLAGEPVTFELEVPYTHGGPRWAQHMFVPDRDEAGRVQGYVAHVVDMSERKQAERKRADLEMQLAHSRRLESIGTLARGAAHEINNPINGVMNYAQLVLDATEESSPLHSYAGEILHESERVATIVRNLLQFAQQEGRAFSPAPIRDMVEQTVSLAGAALRQDQITLEVEIPEDLPVIRCRRRQIQQVLLNLLTNARDALNAKYAGPHDEKVIRMAAKVFEREGQPWVRLTVEDNGTGIPPEVQGHIFDPFFTTKPRNQSQGLGLAIGHGIAREHCGELRFETEPGQWARFHLEVPVDESSEPREEG